MSKPLEDVALTPKADGGIGGRPSADICTYTRVSGTFSVNSQNGGEIYDEHIDARRDETNPVTGATDQKRPLYPNGSHYRTSGIFVNDVVDLVRGTDGPRVAAHLGGRFTHVNVRTEAEQNVSPTGTNLRRPRFGAQLPRLDIQRRRDVGMSRIIGFNALVSRGFRAPNLNDLGALGLNDLGYEIPAGSAIEAGGSELRVDECIRSELPSAWFRR